MRSRHILLVAGARPNFMKVAPLLHELHKHRDVLTTRLVHTGQHYDVEMSDVFFRDLEIPVPDRFLGIGSGSHAEQTAKVMVAFEQVCLAERPDLVVVVGDVNSTLACALTAKKLCLPVAHVEAGLRSRDWSMPEEINRLVTDTISDLLFTPSRDADDNLLQEGISPDRIHFVGNVMVDCLLTQLPKTDLRPTLERYGVVPQGYATLTLHRPSNVDDTAILGGIIEAVTDIAQRLPIIWPGHPRARKMLEVLGLLECFGPCHGLKLTDPMGYLDMLTLNRRARMILTDSGGLQEEATILGVPCLTLRETTERPATVIAGANKVVGNQPDSIRAAASAVLDCDSFDICVPERWDGKAAPRIVDILLHQYS